MKNNFNENVKPVRGLVAQAITVATVNGTGIDRMGFEEAGVILDVSAITDAATLNVKVQESDALASGYADVSGAAFATNIATGAGDNKQHVGRINLVGRKRYIRIVAVGAAGTGGTFSVAVVLCEATEVPVTQVNTLAFNVA